ncbi:MAG: D-alanyl-D-alanine carboxypeptidase/D-alanyl-D-alanine-endopeptidase, partial [Actinomycetota bacterium]|nr:D-alanyl-D-alanine carboxypeptidase/D-alanyl-D-alanine-endopeptidase [Actinomycetota bacterium]
LGPQVRASVVDVDTGAILLDRGAAVGAAPASTAKLLTAAAILTVRKPTDRLTTTVLAGTGAATGTVYLRGGGDPTLTAAAAGKPAAYPQAARLRDLAAAVRRARVSVRRIVVDGSVFAGPDVSPAWVAGDVPSDYASAITGVLVDGGRAAPTDTVRSATPDLAAGNALAALLGEPTLTVSQGTTPVTGARVLGTVSSAPLGTLVQQMLFASDNVIAECLARQVAISRHEPASFTGAAQAVRTVVSGIGIDPGAGLVDGSGLAARDRVSPAALTALLRAGAHSERRSLRSMISALPVAGWSGTLSDRYIRGAQRSAAGDIRAKTGTLTGVSALAGLVHDRSGRLLAFAFIADRTGPTPAAESALDAAATDLSRCGCS